MFATKRAVAALMATLILLAGCAGSRSNDGIVGTDTPIGVVIVHQTNSVDIQILATAWNPKRFAVEPEPGQVAWHISLFNGASWNDEEEFVVPATKPVTIRFVDQDGKEVKRVDLEPQPTTTRTSQTTP